MRADKYDELMSSVSQCQLSLEALVRHLQSSSEDEFPEIGKLKYWLGLMEKYLGSVISEWERTTPVLSKAGTKMKLSDLTRTEDFLSKLSPTDFERKFSKPYHLFHNCLSKEIQNGPSKHT